MSDSLWSHELQHARIPCPSPTPGVYPDSCPLSRCCHPTISFSVIPFSSCLQSFPASGSFLITQFFASGGQSVGASASASVLPVNIQGWFPYGLTGLISLQSNGLSSVFSNTTFQKCQPWNMLRSWLSGIPKDFLAIFIKLLENMEGKLYDFGVGNDSLDKTPAQK